jgi:hypothetical protein
MYEIVGLAFIAGFGVGTLVHAFLVQDIINKRER